MFSRTKSMRSRGGPDSGRLQWPHEVLQGAMFASFSILNYHIGSGTSSVCPRTLPPLRLARLSLSLPPFLRWIFYSAFLRHGVYNNIPSSCAPSFTVSPPFRPFLPRLSLYLSRSKTSYAPRICPLAPLAPLSSIGYCRPPSSIMHLKRRRLKDRRLCLASSEFFNIN